MKRRAIAAILGAGLLLASAPAFAMGQFGVRFGYGLGFHNDEAGDPDSSSAFAAGLAYTLDLTVLDLEIDALYWGNTVTPKSGPDATSAYLAVPVIAKFGLPVVPFLTLGAGLNPRFLLSAEVDGNDVSDGLESFVLYLPIVVGAVIPLGIVDLGVEARYELQLTASAKEPAEEGRVHQLVFMGGVDF